MHTQLLEICILQRYFKSVSRVCCEWKSELSKETTPLLSSDTIVCYIWYRDSGSKSSWVRYSEFQTQVPAHDQAVWKTFWTIFFGAAIAAASSSAISAELSLQPSAPKFSSTCLTVLTPGIGIVPLQMHQLMATCVGSMASSSDYEEHFD